MTWIPVSTLIFFIIYFINNKLFFYLIITLSWHEFQVWWVNLVWRVNRVDSDFFSFSSLVLFFRFHLLILYAVYSKKAKAFSFFLFFYAFHCRLHNAVYGKKVDAFFFFLINFLI
jgi:hypothetical protein